MNIDVVIDNKHAAAMDAPTIVCGNSDYTITFNFGIGWSSEGAKTARFVYVQDGKVKYQDVDFTGSTVKVPILSNIKEVRVGVYAGNLRTTTAARIPCEPSIRCGTGVPDAQTSTGGAITQAQINVLNEMFKKCAYIGDVSAEYTAFKQAFGITDTDEGEEPDTPVTPPEEPDTPVTGVSNETMWTNGVAYTYTPIADEYSDRNSGAILPYNNWERTPYLYCEGASVLRITALLNTSGLNNGNQDNCFYDSEKNFVSAFSFNGKIGESEPGIYTDIVIPDNAAYVIVSGAVGNLSSPRIKLTPYE